MPSLWHLFVEVSGQPYTSSKLEKYTLPLKSLVKEGATLNMSLSMHHFLSLVKLLVWSEWEKVLIGYSYMIGLVTVLTPKS